jgi:hypothetical protein
LITAYYSGHPDPSVPEQRVAFGARACPVDHGGWVR